MKQRMLFVVVALTAVLALAVPVGAASPNSQGAANASSVAWGHWASFDGGMAPGLVPATADENTGDDGTEVDEDGDDGTEVDEAGDDGTEVDEDGDDGTEVDDDQGDDEQADEDTGDEDTDEATGDESAGRPQNHGWFVSQCAHDPAYVGREHGKHVKDCAHSQDGKPSKGDEGDSGEGDTGSGDTGEGDTGG